MTSILTTEDLLQLSIFKCKMCSLRLHNPIMQVEMFGSICGSCFNRSAYTNFTRNEEMEALLAKLYVSCRYVESGCTFDGYYSKMNQHEEACCYREILCPFFNERKCEESLFIKDIIEHIREKHPDSILTELSNGDIADNPTEQCPNVNVVIDDFREKLSEVEENGRVLVNNPTAECPEGCYLIQINGEYFLLKTNLNTEKQWISYDFYHFNNNSLDSKKINSSLIMKHGNSVFDIKREVYVRHVSAIAPTYVGDSTLKAARLKMKSASFLKTVEISGDAKAGAKKTSTGNEVFWKCPRCMKYVGSCISCSFCGCRLCESCNSIKAHPHPQTQRFNFRLLGVTSKIPCENEGCLEFLKPNKMDHHRKYICDFRKYRCPYEETCKNWLSSFNQFRMHIQADHENVLNRNAHVLDAGTKTTLYFIKGNEFFEQVHNLKSTGEYTVSTVKLNTSGHDVGYIWEVHVRRKNSRHALIMFGDFSADGQQEIVNLTHVDDKTKLIVNTYIKRR